MDTKAIIKSKTLWVNILLAGAAVLGEIPSNATADVIVIAVVNVLLRILTTQPLSVTGK